MAHPVLLTSLVEPEGAAEVADWIRSSCAAGVAPREGERDASPSPGADGATKSSIVGRRRRSACGDAVTGS